MTVKERIERRAEFKSDTFVVRDPEHGRVLTRVSEFIGIKHDGTEGIRYDHPAIEFDVIEEGA